MADGQTPELPTTADQSTKATPSTPISDQELEERLRRDFEADLEEASDPERVKSIVNPVMEIVSRTPQDKPDRPGPLTQSTRQGK